MKLRDTVITIFVILWLAVFNYESIHRYYLEPWLKRPLPKMKLLFPPAGWIMFYNVEDDYGYAQIYGVNVDGVQEIDPHEILATRTIGFDNIHRNVLLVVFGEAMPGQVCRFLERKFPEFDNFLITAAQYPSLTQTPHKKLQRVLYQCKEK
ncbi:MAG: hypothetical protein A2787_03185 [Omnitrophica WOR_2 bacterium RIFCSPHIGHO2_01_FULL_48_9]|nr:MAG: hypothetical protein A3D10_01155 [Omnitrophica WOR_2 bacterium RIFCSPHIGHO2_02_FULL_48_11]OGX32020.1 MAG: hypothetical protein A2787_03185 [Omnitrophica WOR_2 bacterium RIFCSPHIGHO2_01_FULL_48_9]